MDGRTSPSSGQASGNPSLRHRKLLACHSRAALAGPSEGILERPDWSQTVEMQERSMARQFDVIDEKDIDGLFVASLPTFTD